MTSIIYVAAGSGGHIIPCLTIAELEKKRNGDTKIIFITSSKKLDTALVQSNPLPNKVYIHEIHSCKPWQLWWYPRLFYSIAYYLYQSWLLIKQSNPKKIVSLGGITSLPICLAGWMLNIPIELYELNAVPGKAVRFISLFAQRIFICFDSASPYFKSKKCILTPYPIRFKKQYIQDTSSAISHKKNILILGGSQGSHFINNFFIQWSMKHPHILSLITITHQTGNAELEKIKKMYKDHAIQATVFDFSNNLESLYRQADIIICRSGAGTLFELLFFEKKCITIPLEGVANDHQSANAYALAHQYPNLITVLTQKDLEKDPDLFTISMMLFLDYNGQSVGFEPNPYI